MEQYGIQDAYAGIQPLAKPEVVETKPVVSNDRDEVREYEAIL